VLEPRELDWPALRAVALLVESGVRTGEQHEVLCLGGTPDEDRLAAAGLSGVHRAPPVRGGFWSRSETIGKAMRRLGPFDCVHAWTARAGAACTGVSEGVPVLVTVSATPPVARIPQRRALCRALERAAHIRFTSRFLRGAWLAWGAPTVRASVAPLPLPIGGAPGPGREAVRSSWGVPSDEPVVLACGAPVSAINARWFSYEVGVMSVAGLLATVVIPDGAAQAERGLRFAQRHTEPWRVVLDDRPVWALLPGAELAVWSCEGVSSGQREGGSGVTPPDTLAWAAAAGVPVVSEDHPASRETLEGLEGLVRFVSASRPTAIIDEIMEALRSPVGARKISVPAGRDPERWVRQTDDLHRSVALRPRPLAPRAEPAVSA